MNDKIKHLLSTAYKTDAIARNKWRIQNREHLREQRKKELKELMEKETTMSNNKQSMKLYTEEQVRHIFENLNISSGYDYNMELYCSSITPIEIPSDDEIKQEADSYHGLESYNTTFVQGAKWMRDKIQGGNNEQR